MDEKSKIPRGRYCYELDFDQIKEDGVYDPWSSPIKKCPFWEWVEDGDNSFATCNLIYSNDDKDLEKKDGDTINTIMLDDDCKVCGENLELDDNYKKSYKEISKLNKFKDA